MHHYLWTGFFQPVDNPPATNSVKAGRAIPIKFSLGGNFGLGVLPGGSPSSRQVTCTSGAAVGAIEQTVTAGASSLQYDQTSNQYTYAWKTEKSWAGTCRQFYLTLNDRSAHGATFQFN
jgi:hypothetical protein